MFSKLKNLFNGGNSQETLPTLNDQFPHPNIPAGDVSQCPFMSKKQKPEQ